MNRLSKILFIFIGVVIFVILIGFGGFWYTPQSPPPHPAQTPGFSYKEISPDLPRPIRNYLQSAVGDSLPVIETAVVWGTARFKLPGLLPIWMPVRWKSYYIPGKAFLREMEITWYGLTFLEGKDSYIDGTGKLIIGDEVTSGPGIDQGQVLALRGEMAFTPSNLALDTTITWRAVDDTTMWMIFPFNEPSDSLQLTFNSETHLIENFTAQRYKETDAMTGWRLECIDWDEFHTMKIPSKISVTWEDEGKPWAYFTIEGVEYNVDVSDAIPD